MLNDIKYNDDDFERVGFLNDNNKLYNLSRLFDCSLESCNEKCK